MRNGKVFFEEEKANVVRKVFLIIFQEYPHMQLQESLQQVGF